MLAGEQWPPAPLLVMDKELKGNIGTGQSIGACEFTFLGTVASDKARTCGRRQQSIDFYVPERSGVTCRVCRGLAQGERHRAASCPSPVPALRYTPSPMEAGPCSPPRTQPKPRRHLGEKGGPVSEVLREGLLPLEDGPSALSVHEDAAMGLLPTQAELSATFFPTKVTAFLKPPPPRQVV